MNKTIKHELSHNTIWQVLITLATLWFFYKTLSVWVIVFISFILMTAFSPVAHLAKKLHLPLFPVMLAIYLISLFLLFSSFASLIPEAVKQTNLLLENLPTLLENLKNYHLIDPSNLTSHLTSASGSAIKLISSLFSNVLNLLLIFFLTYYLFLEKQKLGSYIAFLLKQPTLQPMINRYLNQVEHEVGSWVRGELALMLIIGIMSYIGFGLLSLPYALPLAVIAGALELIPNLGPTIAAVPAILVGFTISPLTAFGTFALTILIQQLENNLIVPQVMKKAVGLSPLVTIIVLLLGYSVAGVLGATLAIPFFLVCRSLYTISNEGGNHANNQPS